MRQPAQSESDTHQHPASTGAESLLRRDQADTFNTAKPLASQAPPFLPPKPPAQQQARPANTGAINKSTAYISKQSANPPLPQVASSIAPSPLPPSSTHLPLPPTAARPPPSAFMPSPTVNLLNSKSTSKAKAKPAPAQPPAKAKPTPTQFPPSSTVLTHEQIHDQLWGSGRKTKPAHQIFEEIDKGIWKGEYDL